MQAEATPRRWWEFLPEHPARERLFYWGGWVVGLVFFIGSVGLGLSNLYKTESTLWMFTANLIGRGIPCALLPIGAVEFYRFVSTPLKRTPWLIRNASWLLLIHVAIQLYQSVPSIWDFVHLDDPANVPLGIYPLLISGRLLVPVICIGLSQALVYLVPWIETANRTGAAADVTT